MNDEDTTRHGSFTCIDAVQCLQLAKHSVPTPRTLRAWYGIVQFNVPLDFLRVTLSRVPDKDQGQGQQHMRFAGELLLTPSDHLWMSCEGSHWPFLKVVQPATLPASKFRADDETKFVDVAAKQ